MAVKSKDATAVSRYHQLLHTRRCEVFNYIKAPPHLVEQKLHITIATEPPRGRGRKRRWTASELRVVAGHQLWTPPAHPSVRPSVHPVCGTVPAVSGSEFIGREDIVTRSPVSSSPRASGRFCCRTSAWCETG